VLSEWTTELRPETARALCAELLPRAPGLTTGQLIDQIKKLAIALDPDWAQRRYEQALAERRVVGSRNPDGSANLSGYNLPVERVAAACGHIDALAKTAKHAGDPRPIDHIRADLFLGMTEGTYTGLDDHTILERLRVTHGNEGGADDGRPDPGGPDDGSAEGAGSAADDPAQHSRVGTGMELRVRLSTLLGHNEYPAELAGWGPVHAELARDLAATLACGEWRFAITDEQGQLLHCGITRARPTGAPTRMASCHAIVELQIPATTLRDLASAPDALGSWGLVVADLTHQHSNAQRPATGDPTRRFPGAALRRHVEIRDRYCVMIGCRAPATSTDTDHTLDHASGGATAEPNLGNACRHDHRLKHEGGWQLHQPEPGLFRWRSRLGHTYLVRPSPIVEPLPDPIPRDRPAPPLVLPPDDDWDTSRLWDDTPPEADTKPPPEPDPDHDPPPF
jgi:Domain of unknown function (DUF222)